MNVRDKVKWVTCSKRGFSVHIIVEMGTIMDFSKPTGKMALVEKVNGEQVYVARKRLQEMSTPLTLTLVS